MKRLFDKVCDIVFTFPDGSELLCRTTLDPGLLSQYGYTNVDGFVDLSSGRYIPEELFLEDFSIFDEGTYQLSDLDNIFNSGGKLSWEHAKYF